MIFTCRKCGNHTYRRREYKIHGKSMVDYRRKLAHQCPTSFNRYDSKVICCNCGCAQRTKLKEKKSVL